MKKGKFLTAAIAAAALFGSCTKMDKVNILATGNFNDTTGGPLKSAASFPVGFAIDNGSFMNNAAYKATVLKEASTVTFGNELKYGSVVQNDGTFNFSTADALYTAASSGGIAVYGHVLGWHSQQNGTYLKNYSGLVIPTAVELYTNNAGFENGLNGWTTFNSNGATIAADNLAADAHTGTGCMKVVNPTAQTGNQYKVQESSSSFTVTPGKQYSISYWVKAASAGGSIRLSTGPTSPQYQGDQTIGTAWQQVTWNITPTLSSMTFLFDMGQVANTYFIDDVSIKEVVAVPSGTQVANKLDTALNKWITAAVGHYAGKIKAWDVINELFADDGNLRNNANTSNPNNDPNILVWSNYLGRDYPFKAFTYAKAADPAALLFINDYNLETSNAKLDSLIAMVKELKARGAKVDGIGTQLHIAWNTGYTGIDNMMKKLAATGLLIRISELDVKINPIPKVGFVLTPTEAAYQADMYRYIVNSYLTNIPPAQQYGITIWGVDDATSWLYKNGTDFPVLYNADYSRKPAYAAVLSALKGSK